MTSDKQIEANRSNALQSTGPKTDAGKAIVAWNALKHGLSARRVLLPDEDEEELVQFVERLRDHFEPVGEVEVLLVERVIAAAWRLRRVYRVEADVFSTRFYDILADRAHKEAETYQRSTYDELLESNRVVTDAARREQALAKAAEARTRRDADETTLGGAFVRDAAGANAFSKLSRYEAGLERSMYRALRELERLQAGRRGPSDSPRAAPA